MDDKWELLEKGIYMICEALISIVDLENCTYGFSDVVEMASDYMKAYEEDHPDGGAN